jgi:hypothetical protein
MWGDFERFYVIWKDLKRFEAKWNDLTQNKTIWGDVERFETILGEMKRFWKFCRLALYLKYWYCIKGILYTYIIEYII